VGSILGIHESERSRKTVASADKHVNHATNDAAAIKERQSDPHFHALAFEPYFYKIAYVPDLGMDKIRQFVYNGDDGKLIPCGSLPSGPTSGSCADLAHGPRYMEFHRTLPIVYVINELSSIVSVFRVDLEAVKALIACNGSKDIPTLKNIQNVATIPHAFPRHLNTCGRITIHPNAPYVVVSNRGHDSLAVLRISMSGEDAGKLCGACFTHTRGATPRHFAFDSSGQWLIVANQDADHVAIFEFKSATGKLCYTGNQYHVKSPNFVCMCDIP